MKTKLTVSHRALKVWQAGLMLATALSVAASADALVSVETRSSSFAQASQQGVSSFAEVQNGVLPGGGSNMAGANGSSSAGPVGSGVTTAFANTSQIDGPVLTTSTTTADLATGKLGVHAQAGGGPGIGASIAIGLPRWTDTVTFNNTSGSPVELDIFWETDGSVVDTGGPGYGGTDIISSIVVSVINDANVKDVHFKGCPAFYLGGCQFLYSKGSGSGFTFGPNGNNIYGAWTTTPIGAFSGLIKATLIVPSGVVSISLTTYLSIDARTGAVCDYTEGASFKFGPLPSGLTWTSESGVFLSAIQSVSVPVDTDGDGTPDASDGCPNDPLKIAPGLCGCGVSDADANNDGVGDACAPAPTPDPAGDTVDVGSPVLTSQCGTGMCGAMSMFTLSPTGLVLVLMGRRGRARRYVNARPSAKCGGR